MKLEGAKKRNADMERLVSLSKPPYLTYKVCEETSRIDIRNIAFTLKGFQLRCRISIVSIERETTIDRYMPAESHCGGTQEHNLLKVERRGLLYSQAFRTVVLLILLEAFILVVFGAIPTGGTQLRSSREMAELKLVDWIRLNFGLGIITPLYGKQHSVNRPSWGMHCDNIWGFAQCGKLIKHGTFLRNELLWLKKSTLRL